MALLSKSCWVLYLLLVAEGNPGPGQEDAGSECPASSIPETVWGVQALREVLAFCGFAGGEEHGVVYLPFSTFPPIFPICFRSNPNRDWVARKASVSIETICSIRETIYLVMYEI